MEESNDVQALEKISSEVDESQVKVIFTSQCIKAQAYLLSKLQKQSERHKETCSFISCANLKVETEIKHAEHEIRSMLIAKDTIKSANVEIKKEWLLAKTRKEDIIDRVTEGKNKYEALWMECKTRYESIPFVQKLLLATEKQKKTNQDIVDLDKHITNLYDYMAIQRKKCAEVDKNRCLELANYMVNEIPKAVNIINEKSEMINVLTKEIQLLKEKEDNIKAVVNADVKEPTNSIEIVEDNMLLDAPNLSKNDDNPLMPKLNLVNFDLDMINVNLDEVRLTKDKILSTIPTTTSSIKSNLEKNVEQRHETDKAYEYIISPYFKPYGDKYRNFSESKLINILDDVNINDSQVYNIVKRVNPEQLKTVGEISGAIVESDKMQHKASKNKDDKPIVSEEIEEVDLTLSSNAELIIIPPTQFLDMTVSGDTTRKRVSFDLPSSTQINEIIDDDIQEDADGHASVNQTLNSQLDVSAGSDESFMRIREMLIKKHNLDLSPQFTYAKNVIQKKEDDKIVTSKFFQTHDNENKTNEHNGDAMETDEQPRVEDGVEILKPQNDGNETQLSQKYSNENILMPIDLDDVDLSSPKKDKVNLQTCEEQKLKKPVTGLLFTHEAQGIPDSLNASLSTTGFEDSEFPHCIDSSLLLSPKAYIPATSDNHEGLSQEVPNFLSGFRKTGFSFFCRPSTSSEHKPDSCEDNEAKDDNFSFNFGGEKKNRGGLFNLFR